MNEVIPKRLRNFKFETKQQCVSIFSDIFERACQCGSAYNPKLFESDVPPSLNIRKSVAPLRKRLAKYFYEQFLHWHAFFAAQEPTSRADACMLLLVANALTHERDWRYPNPNNDESHKEAAHKVIDKCHSVLSSMTNAGRYQELETECVACLLRIFHDPLNGWSLSYKERLLDCVWWWRMRCSTLCAIGSGAHQTSKLTPVCQTRDLNGIIVNLIKMPRSSRQYSMLLRATTKIVAPPGCLFKVREGLMHILESAEIDPRDAEADLRSAVSHHALNEDYTTDEERARMIHCYEQITELFTRIEQDISSINGERLVDALAIFVSFSALVGKTSDSLWMETFLHLPYDSSELFQLMTTKRSIYDRYPQATWRFDFEVSVGFDARGAMTSRIFYEGTGGTWLLWDQRRKTYFRYNDAYVCLQHWMNASDLKQLSSLGAYDFRPVAGSDLSLTGSHQK